MLSKVIELSGVFLMMDMKAEVENTSIKMICKENIKDMCNMAEFYSCKKLSSACVKFIVEEGVDMKEEDVRQAPAIAAACLEAYKNFKHASEKRSASKSLKSKQDAAICWALNPTTAVNFSETGVYSKAGNRAIQHQLQILGSYTLAFFLHIVVIFLHGPPKRRDFMHKSIRNSLNLHYIT